MTGATMHVAFYKGRERLFNRAVSGYLRGPYSHCELVLWTDNGWSYCASSSFMDGGVRTKRIQLNPAHWDLVPVVASQTRALVWVRAHEGDGYDLLGLAGFVWRPFTGEKCKWVCSEAVAAMLGFPDPWRFDPMVLYCALMARAQISAAAATRTKTTRGELAHA